MSRKQFSKSERLAVYKKCNGHCAYCGCKLEYKDMQIDHINPVYISSLRGAETDNSIDNLMPSCRSCNFYKSTFSIEELRQRIAVLPERLEKEFIYRLAKRYGIIEEKNNPIVFYFEKMKGDVKSE
jgi:hypothetical protein